MYDPIDDFVKFMYIRNELCRLRFFYCRSSFLSHWLLVSWPFSEHVSLMILCAKNGIFLFVCLVLTGNLVKSFPNVIRKCQFSNSSHYQ